MWTVIGIVVVIAVVGAFGLLWVAVSAVDAGLAAARRLVA